MRFRLSTLLLVTTLLSILFAWCVEYHTRSRREITGVWHYPTADRHMSGYWDTLTILPNGTFTKCERHRIGSETYSGAYTIESNGLITFHVTSKTCDSGSIPEHVESYVVDKIFRCRLARDANGNLLVLNLDRDDSTDVKIVFPEDVDVEWQACYSQRKYDWNQRFLDSVRNSPPPRNPSE